MDSGVQRAGLRRVRETRSRTFPTGEPARLGRPLLSWTMKPHFLEDLLKPGSAVYLLSNARTGQVVARHLELAGNSKARRRGLLGRTSLSPDAVMIIAPCDAIHTFFMKF